METLRAALRNGSRPAVTASSTSLTYSQLLAASSRVAGLFKDVSAESAVGSGDPDRGRSTHDGTLEDGPRIAIFGTPGAEFVSALWAAWRVGHVAVPLATSHPPAELLYVMRDAVRLPTSRRFNPSLRLIWLTDIRRWRILNCICALSGRVNCDGYRGASPAS